VTLQQRQSLSGPYKMSHVVCQWNCGWRVRGSKTE